MENQGTQGQGRRAGGGGKGGVSPKPLLTAAGQDGDGEERFHSQARSKRGRNPGPESCPSAFLQFWACCPFLGLISLQVPSMLSLDALDGIDALVPAAPALR